MTPTTPTPPPADDTASAGDGSALTPHSPPSSTTSTRSPPHDHPERYPLTDERSTTMRNANAADTLAAEFNVTLEPIDEPDGFGVHRRFRFDKDSSDHAKAVLAEIDDARFASVENTAHGLVVEFVTTRFADDRAPFGVAEISAALDQAPGEEPEEEKPKTRKPRKPAE